MPGHSGSGTTERKPTKRACASLGCVVPFFSHFSRAFFVPVFVLPVTDNRRCTTCILLFQLTFVSNTVDAKVFPRSVSLSGGSSHGLHHRAFRHPKGPHLEQRPRAVAVDKKRSETGGAGKATRFLPHTGKVEELFF